jgi:hypothetical protein
MHRVINMSSGNYPSISVEYLQISNKKKRHHVQICFTVEINRYYVASTNCLKQCEGDCTCYTEHSVQNLVLSTNNFKQCGANPTILKVDSPGKIISLNMIQISPSNMIQISPSNGINNKMYNLLVLFTKGDEQNLFLNVYRISYDCSSILQPAGYHKGHYRCVRWILSIPLIFTPVNHLAQVSFAMPASRMSFWQLFKNMKFLTCNKRFMSRLKIHGQILSFVIRRLIPTYKTVRHHPTVYNKIETSIMSRVYNNYLKFSTVLHTEDESLPSLHLIWSETQNNLVAYRKIIL